MNQGKELPDSAEAPGVSEVERLLEKVASSEQVEADVRRNHAAKMSVSDGVQAYDFRNPMLLSPRELRKLTLHQEEFINALASRLSIYLRLECSLILTRLETVTYQKMAETWADPSHLTLFKVEPLRGVSILELPPRLGLCMVDRLMGGPGQSAESVRDLSEIEQALLEQAVQLLLGEWCSHWSKLKDLKPVLLGSESNGRFIQSSPPETMMLTLAMEAHVGDCTAQIQIGFPYAPFESLIRQLSQSAEKEAEPTVPAKPATPCKWNPCLDEVCIPVTAEWQGMELAARELLALKLGDVLHIDLKCVEQVNVRLADHAKFSGRLGTVAGKWAVELTQLLNR